MFPSLSDALTAVLMFMSSLECAFLLSWMHFDPFSCFLSFTCMLSLICVCVIFLLHTLALCHCSSAALLSCIVVQGTPFSSPLLVLPLLFLLSISRAPCLPLSHDASFHLLLSLLDFPSPFFLFLFFSFPLTRFPVLLHLPHTLPFIMLSHFATLQFSPLHA